jgi:UPF0716 family protein affecting phage T7 exclusion
VLNESTSAAQVSNLVRLSKAMGWPKLIALVILNSWLSCLRAKSQGQWLSLEVY